MTTSWRKEWFDYVRSVRKKVARQTKKECTHKQAMNIASQTWSSYKIKLQRKYARQNKKITKNEVELDNKNLTSS